jgi:hypothetical protein
MPAFDSQHGTLCVARHLLVLMREEAEERREITDAGREPLVPNALGERGTRRLGWGSRHDNLGLHDFAQGRNQVPASRVLF